MIKKIKKDDLVEVIAGANKGRKAKVLRVYPKKDKVVLENVNVVKKHTKPDADNTRGGIIEMEAPIHVSNVLLVDPSTKSGARVGFRYKEDGSKVRFFKGSEKEIK